MAHDLMAPAHIQRQDPMLEEEVGVGPGCQCGQLGEELEALEEAVDCPAIEEWDRTFAVFKTLLNVIADLGATPIPSARSAPAAAG